MKRFFADIQKQRVDESESCLEMFRTDRTHKYVTKDQTWTGAGKYSFKRPKTQLTWLWSVFGDENGILFVDCLRKGQTINMDHYVV